MTDTIPPQAGLVFDGESGDLETQTSTTSLSANWRDFTDDSGSIAGYEWAIGTSPGGTEVQTWTAVGTATMATNSTLVLELGTTYFSSVRASDDSNNVSLVVSSNGVGVDDPPGGGGPPGPGNTALASSITQFGITWQFDQPMPVGQFANGDYYVVGPVSIVSISPPSTVVSGRTINGSMINPGLGQIPEGYQGYDSTLYSIYGAGYFIPSLNVAMGVSPTSPLELSPGKSLISTISWTSPSAPESGSVSQLRTAAVLTVLDQVAPEGSFRPPYSGNDKTVRFYESQLNYGVLGTVAPSPGMPSFSETLAGFQRPWLDHCSGWSSRYMHPVENMPDYGRNFTALYGTGCLMLQLDIPNSQKRDMLVRLVQIGIDFMANVQNGGVWTGVGGQCSGRKFPILLAGKVLGDAQMLAIGTTHPSQYLGPNHPSNSEHFGEDCQTFYVTQTSPGTYNWGYGGYTATHANMPEWGNSHTQYPSNDNVAWQHDPYRRCCTANAWVGQTLTARMLNLQGAWNHPSYFDYMDRFMQTEPTGWTRAWVTWQERMWDQYRTTF